MKLVDLRPGALYRDHLGRTRLKTVQYIPDPGTKEPRFCIVDLEGGETVLVLGSEDVTELPLGAPAPAPFRRTFAVEGFGATLFEVQGRLAFEVTDGDHVLAPVVCHDSLRSFAHFVLDAVDEYERPPA